MCRPRRSRSASSPLGFAGLRATSTSPKARPTAPSPLNQASRAKSCVPGKCHRRRRRKPGADLQCRPCSNSRRSVVRLQRHADSRRKVCPDREQGQPQVSLCRERLDPLDPCASKVVTFGRSRRGAPTHSDRSPDEGATQRQRKPQPADGALQPSTIESEARNGHGARQGKGRPAIRRGPSSANQHAMPAPKPITSQMGSCPRSRSRKASAPSRAASKRAFQ